MTEIQDLTYMQLLKYYNFKEVKHTNFTVIYLNNSSNITYEYALFLNKENGNALSLLDIYKRTLINRDELLKFAENFIVRYPFSRKFETDLKQPNRSLAI